MSHKGSAYMLIDPEEFTCVQTSKNMPPWKPGTTEFPMKVIPNGKAGTYHINVPPVIREKLGNPTHIKFVIRGSKVLVKGASK